MHICTPTSPLGDKTSEPSDFESPHILSDLPQNSSTSLPLPISSINSSSWRWFFPEPFPNPPQPLAHRISRCTCSPVVSWMRRLCSTAPACEASPLLAAATAGSSGCRSRSRKPLHPNVWKPNREETWVRSWRRARARASNNTPNQQICFLKTRVNTLLSTLLQKTQKATV